MNKLTSAYVLCDVPAHGAKAGQILDASAALIKALHDDGSVDPLKGALDAARAIGAVSVRSTVELAAEQAAEQTPAKRGAKKGAAEEATSAEPAADAAAIG